MTTANVADIFGEVIHSYSRAQAIADGVLIDASPLAREYGINWPVALTAAAWDDMVSWDDDDARQQEPGQSETGRLWDVLTIVRFMVLPKACRIAQQEGAAEVTSHVLRVPRDGESVSATKAPMTVALGPGDDGSPCITVMLPGED